MDDHNAQLGALTNQRVSIRLGTTTYSARRATLYDVGLVNRFCQKKQQDGDTANLDLDASFYVLSELIKPDVNLSPDDLAKSMSFENFTQVTEALQTVGFKLPQMPVVPTK